jgi:hypothetical protein
MDNRHLPSNSFRLVTDGSKLGIIMECGTEEAAVAGYKALLQSCKERGSMTLTVKGQPLDSGGFILERGVNYSDDT